MGLQVDGLFGYHLRQTGAGLPRGDNSLCSQMCWPRCTISVLPAFSSRFQRRITRWNMSKVHFLKNIFPKNSGHQKIGVDPAETEPLKSRLIFKLRDSIFADPPRPALRDEFAVRPCREWVDGRFSQSRSTATKSLIMYHWLALLEPTTCQGPFSSALVLNCVLFEVA